MQTLHVAYVCTPRCILLRVFGSTSCCIRLHTIATRTQQHATSLAQQCWEFLRPFARSLRQAGQWASIWYRHLDVCSLTRIHYMTSTYTPLKVSRNLKKSLLILYSLQKVSNQLNVHCTFISRVLSTLTQLLRTMLTPNCFRSCVISCQLEGVELQQRWIVLS